MPRFSIPNDRIRSDRFDSGNVFAAFDDFCRQVADRLRRPDGRGVLAGGRIPAICMSGSMAVLRFGVYDDAMNDMNDMICPATCSLRFAYGFGRFGRTRPALGTKEFSPDDWDWLVIGSFYTRSYTVREGGKTSFADPGALKVGRVVKKWLKLSAKRRSALRRFEKPAVIPVAWKFRYGGKTASGEPVDSSFHVPVLKEHGRFK